MMCDSAGNVNWAPTSDMMCDSAGKANWAPTTASTITQMPHSTRRTSLITFCVIHMCARMHMRTRARVCVCVCVCACVCVCVCVCMCVVRVKHHSSCFRVICVILIILYMCMRACVCVCVCVCACVSLASNITHHAFVSSASF